MRLKKIEVLGFKSFADRQVLIVDDHVTGVIGPNGCGNSNIVDAVRWSMGEQSAKHLRGTSDVQGAFAGYEAARRARVERVVRYANRVGTTKIAGPIGRWFRDLLMPVALKLFARSSSHGWLYRHHIDWERAA